MDLLLIFVAVLVVIIALFGSFAWKIYKLDQEFADIPGPPNDSFLQGCIPLLQPYFDSGNAQALFYELHLKYGKTFKIRLVNRMFVSSCDTDMIKEILSSGRHPKSELLTMVFGKLFGTRYMSDRSILTETDVQRAQWKRAQFNSMFHKGYFKAMTSDFNTAIDPLINKLVKSANGKTIVTMLDEFNSTALDVLSKIAFGIDMESAESSTTNPLTTSINVTFSALVDQQKDFLYMIKPWNWGNILRARKETMVIRNYGKKLIDARISAKANGDYVPDDILSLIAQMKENNPEMDEENLLDDFLTFFVAGQETTAGLLSFMILSLGQNPNCMKKLQEEVDEVVGEKSVIDSNDLQRLNYLDMVMKETLRLFPPVPASARSPSTDVTIGGVTVPKGCIMAMATYSAHRLEENFENPLTFDPERFSTENKSSIKPYTYFPFALGPRTCIGKFFADTEAKIIMTKLVQRFEWQLDPGQTFDVQEIITLKPKGRAAVTLTLRN